MHKKAIELIKKAISEVETYESTGCMTSDKWEDFYHCVAGLSKAVCAEKDYQIIEAMKKSEEEEKIADMALRRAGYAMPKRPYMDDDDYTRQYIDNPHDFERNMRLGYTPNYSMNTSRTSDHGQAYDNYKNAMRHYTATHSPEDLKTMENAITEFFDEMEMLAMDVTKDLDPNKRQHYVNKIQQMGQKVSQR